MKVLIDMDGVLADFMGGLCEALGRENPYDDRRNHGKWATNDLWGIPEEEMWKPCDRAFWASLKPTAECHAIVEACVDVAGLDNCCILSSPSQNEGCVDGKMDWIKRHIPKFSRRFLFGPKKEFCSNPNHMLIDDADHNVRAFRDGGGFGLLLPRPWNARHAESGKCYIQDVRFLLNRHREFLEMRRMTLV